MGYADFHYAAKDAGGCLSSFLVLAFYFLAAVALVLVMAAGLLWVGGRWTWQAVQDHRQRTQVLP